MRQVLCPLIFACCFFTPLNSALLPTDPHYITKVETEMAKVLRQYIEAESTKLALLETYATYIEQRAEDDAKIAEFDPVRLYQMVKSLAEEWADVYGTITADQASIELRESLEDGDLNVPNPRDAEEVALAIFRIQDTYLYTPSDIIAKGISDFEHPTQDISETYFAARDCFNLGMVAYERSVYYHAITWFLEAERRLANEAKPTMSELEIWRPLVVAFHQHGNHYSAFRLITQLEELFKDMNESERGSALEEFPDLRDLMYVTYTRKNRKDAPVPLISNRKSRVNITAIYEAMCREGQKNMKLVCYYRKETPFLQLAPAKVEALHIDPLVLLYRGIISDNESRIIQSLAKDQLKRGKVIKGQQRIFSEQRTSSTAWCDGSHHPLIAVLRKRAGDFTGLDVSSFDSLQVARYGFGGHYFFHFDYMTDEQRQQHGYHGSYSETLGDRMATLMFYLAEPEGGGGFTVFPYLDLAVPPSKKSCRFLSHNDAILWYNLKRDGTGITTSLHGGCPVISGTKWVANQWIRERGQEFARPCGLHKDEIDWL